MISNEIATEKIQKLVTNCCKKLIRQGLIRRNDLEDAQQEGFTAYLEGNNIVTHLIKWARSERCQRF